MQCKDKGDKVRRALRQDEHCVAPWKPQTRGVSKMIRDINKK